MASFERILAIETSCDDTSVAIVDCEGFVEALCSAHQDLLHQPFGGVVPEVASRNHTLSLLPLVDEALKKSHRSWSEISAIAVTARPGLVGSLLVGLVTAKTLALSKNIPFIGVNHLEGHIMAPFLRDRKYQPPEDFGFPCLTLAISGGHTQIYLVQSFGVYQVLGATLDDAAGEAFDKFAKMLGLGFPGGVKVDEMATQGDPFGYNFPRALLKEDNFNFSFSGLKTAAQRLLETMSVTEKRQNVHSLCASFQEAIVDCLLAKLDKAVDFYDIHRVTLTGGVSANSRLRSRSQEWAREKSLQLVIPPLSYCTDNAAMIGLAGIRRLMRGEFSEQSLAPSARSLPGDFV